MKTLPVIALLCALFAVPAAFGDSFTDFTITFTGSGTLAIPAPTAIVYDATANEFQSFAIVWDGGTFDFASMANTFVPSSSAPVGCLGPTDAATLLNVLTAPSGCVPTFLLWSGTAIQIPSTSEVEATFSLEVPFTNLPLKTVCDSCQAPPAPQVATGSANGSFSVPEPGSRALMLIGLALVALIMRMSTGRSADKSFVSHQEQSEFAAKDS